MADRPRLRPDDKIVMSYLLLAGFGFGFLVTLYCIWLAVKP